MTEPTESTIAAPEVVIDTLASADLRKPKLQTFDEMLPAASAFYLKSSKR